MTWIREQMLGGFEGISFPKEPIVWLSFLAAVLNVVISIVQGDLAFFPDGVESIVMLILGLVGRGMVKPLAKI